MSWFDSSFSFAKTALSQAQKSIDKVLDIKDEHGSSQAILDPVNDVFVSTSAATSSPSTTSSEASSSIKTHGTPDPPAKSADSLSTWFSPSQTEQIKKSEKAQADGSTPVTDKSGSSSMFGSTWGAGDSFWGSYFGSPGPSDQGPGGGGGGSKNKSSSSESLKEAPKPTSMVRTSGSKRLKSQTSSSSKTHGSEQRKKVTSPRPSSPPKSSSSPLPQSREEERSSTGDDSCVGSSSKSNSLSSSRPDQVLETATEFESRSKSRSMGITVMKVNEVEVETVSSERSGETKTKSTSDENLRSRVTSTPDVSEPVGETKDVDVEAATEDFSVTVKSNALPVVDETDSIKEETNRQPDTSKPPLSLEDSRTEKDVKLMKRSSSSASRPSPEPIATDHDTTERNTAQVPQSQIENNSDHSLVHSQQAQNDNTDTRQTTVEQKPLANQNLESKLTGQENDSSTCKSMKQDERVKSRNSTPELPHTESEEVDTGNTVTTTASTLHQLLTSPTSDDQRTSEPGRSPASVAAQDEVEGERREPMADRANDESTKSEEAAITVESPDVYRLEKELAEIRQVLEVREQKMVEMSRDSISLRETNQSLEEELAEAKRTGQTDIEELRSEFARRLATAEKKLQAVVKERDSLKKQLLALQDEQTQQKRSVGDEWGRMIKEKDEQIAQLMEEGEKLSKQELQSNSIIKKLRLKDKQNDQLLAAQRQQIEDLEGKVKILKEQVKKKEETEAKYQESFGQLNTIAEQQAKELASLKTERDELFDKVRSLQTNLDNSYKELAELQKANAVTQSAAQEAALTAEQSAREQLKSVLDQQKLGAQREKEALLMQVDELRMSVSRAEQQAAWREDHLRQELTDMQQRLQEAESRNQELTSSISQATKPLLRQIENLQAAHSAQSANWDKIEANLTQRLVQTQAQLSQSSEKERSAVEKEMTLQSRVRALEAQLSSTKQEKSQLLATLELERAKLQTLEESQHRESAKTEALRTSYQQSMDELRREKEMLERQLEYERVRLEAECRKASLESQEKERLRAQLASSLSLNRTISRQSSSGSQSDILERSLHAAVSEGGGGSRSLHAAASEGSMADMSLHTSRGGVTSSASLIEHLQSLLKQKEGELANSQNLVGSLERSRAAMAEDLANISAQNETLKIEVETIPPLKQKLQEVERKHEAMLQMYGEKAEEAEELKLDIDDLKTMYRQQIEELLSKRR